MRTQPKSHILQKFSAEALADAGWDEDEIEDYLERVGDMIPQLASYPARFEPSEDTHGEYADA